jgi:hypothetical protein
MDRRSFLAAGASAGVVAAAGSARADAPDMTGLDIYELRRYTLKAGEREKQFEDYLSTALVPVLSNLGVGPIGAFKPVQPEDPAKPCVYVLLTYAAPEVVGAVAMLGWNADYRKAAAPFLDLPAANPIYQRVDSSLLIAFAGQPNLKAPDKAKPRMFELRTYQSPNERYAATKIDMFNSGEIDIFKRAAMPVVFLGQTMCGSGLPNLNYMITFPDMAGHDAGWKAFQADPDWAKLKNDPKYKDTVSHIDHTILTPLAVSQI